MEPTEVAVALCTADDLARDGVTRGALRRAVAEGRLVVVRRGWYVDVDAGTWSGWRSEARTAARAIAAARAVRGEEVASSHTDALALLGLPLYRCTPRRAHLTGPAMNGGTAGTTARHRAPIEGDTLDLHGIRVTSLPRTIADVAGRLPLATAVAAADAALRRVAWVGGPDPYDEAADARFRSEVHACSSLQPGAAGRVQAEWVLTFADGRAQLPGESVTRVHLHRLGFAAPRLQVRVALPGRRWYDIDLGLDDAGVWLEFDGTGKYTDPAWRGDRDPLQVVLDEKKRMTRPSITTSRRESPHAGCGDLMTRPGRW